MEIYKKKDTSSENILQYTGNSGISGTIGKYASRVIR